MNPTDQARKEARKRELKKNKKQRMLVRQAVLKGKDPKHLIQEMEHIDRMEYDPVNPPPYNIKVLQEKRKKIRDTWDRVLRLYSKEEPHQATQMVSMQAEYEKTRAQLISWFESVKETQRVLVDEIPLPELPADSTSNIPMPGEIPLPNQFDNQQQPPRSILKHKQSDTTDQPQQIIINRKPPGPPPGIPPLLSDNEDDDDIENNEALTNSSTSNERRRIRFVDPPPSSKRKENESDAYELENLEFPSISSSSQPYTSTTANTSKLVFPIPPFPPPPGMRLPPPPPPYFPPGHVPPGIRLPTRPFPPGMQQPPKLARQQHSSTSSSSNQPNVFSAPPSLINKPTTSTSTISAATPSSTKNHMTIEAKPVIRARQEVTKFVPTVLKVKRPGKKQVDPPKTPYDNSMVMKARMANAAMVGHLTIGSTDDAYDTFMKEISQLG
ncbi:unnamed protein product [Didymodactylos carnosus]|uniref:Wbp11/ELF5/Saf1 N-terminal domain-containing protein n=1 Tax=Didymodactylos carnosus TaxID=1234261 RepID=A0A814KB83_9BILA|nr:unnamed protein product [Didymodactylos carnosus]CAF1049092.1 unnamed protein product [Didymodactylos carnosus]CAF3550345.1 unnamed protein product [Didymodactylos carnosus]CAF3818742.1 unnamed protein product [Didymodactylos carnosus]